MKITFHSRVLVRIGYTIALLNNLISCSYPNNNGSGELVSLTGKRGRSANQNFGVGCSDEMILEANELPANQKIRSNFKYFDNSSLDGSLVQPPTEYGKMMQFLDDNYQLAHEGVQGFLGIEALTFENTAKKLQQACFVGNSEAIATMINEGVDIRMLNDMAIKTAVDMNHNHIVKGLFNYGCDSFEVMKYILKTAVRKGNSDLVQFVCGKEKCTRDLKENALAEAVLFGKLNIVTKIFGSCAEDSNVPFYLAKLAEIKGFTDIMQYIHDQGYENDVDNDEVLVWGSKLGNIEVVQLLISEGAYVDYDDNMALQLASMYGHIDVVKFLLENEADVDEGIDRPLCLASGFGHIDVARLLLEYGADIHETEYEAFIEACSNGHADIARLFLEKEADIHAEDDKALRLASRYGHTAVVALLLDNHANVHAEDNEALKWASFNGHTAVVKLLLENHANVDADDNAALKCAYNNGHAEVVQLLLQYGAHI